MKLATYRRGTEAAPAVIQGDRVHFFAELDPRLPGSLELLLDGGEAAMDALRAAMLGAGEGEPLDPLRLMAPIRHPRKYMGIGFNYSSHVDEVRRKGHPIPDLSNQIWFNKQTSCIVGPYDPIHLPAVSEQLDYECELGVVIGRSCRHVSESDAFKVIAGYMVTNDVSVRDWQLKAPTATLGKSFDTHGPIGPWLTTADEVPEPETLGIRTIVDGVVLQDGNTSEMVNGIAAQIAYLSSVVTLEPGDILATGTPHGVAAGRTPVVWLKAGQRVRVEIDGLGHIENRVIDEPLDQTTFIR
jgi:2-keto-4-pentenoate hydratase/2-oxohepta-3-ene-1,7-dioic acid hydratase in catechol pathway